MDMMVFDHPDLSSWDSMDLQLIIELEHRMHEFADNLERVGEFPTY